MKIPFFNKDKASATMADQRQLNEGGREFQRGFDNILGDDELRIRYNNSSILQNVICYPIFDAMREGRTFTIEGDTDNKKSLLIAEEETRLNVKSTLIEARRQANLYGGCAILMVRLGTEIKEINYEEPLDPTTIKKGNGIDYLRIIPKRSFHNLEIVKAYQNPRHGDPEFFNVMTNHDGTNSATQLKIHHSHLVIFKGKPDVSSRLNYDNRKWWGMSHAQSLWQPIEQLERELKSGVEATIAGKVGVMAVKDGATKALTPEGRKQLLDETSNIAKMQDQNAIILMDAESRFEKHAFSLAGISDLAKILMTNVSACAGIPETRLFQVSPSGLNATGQSERIDYIGRLRREQELEINPAIKGLTELIVRGALGEYPEGLTFAWNDVFDDTPEQKIKNASLQLDMLIKTHNVAEGENNTSNLYERMLNILNTITPEVKND